MQNTKQRRKAMPYAEDYHASVLIIGPKNEIVLIIQDHHDLPLWKFAGGGSEIDETPEQTAIREALEETGLIVESDSLRHVDTQSAKSMLDRNGDEHKKYFFVGRTKSLAPLKKRGDGGERPGIFQLEEVERMVDIHPQYFNAFLKAKEAGFV